MKKLIAVIDDEPDIRRLVSLHLGRAHFAVAEFGDAASFLTWLSTHHPALIILDLMLPDEDGLDVCRRMRRSTRHQSTPIIMLTARGQEADKILGLELGADDYITKPFSPRELVARVKAVLRRGAPAPERILSVGELTIDPQEYTVTATGAPVTLTAVEFKILHLLAAHPRRVFSRDQILDHLWGNEKAVQDRTVDVHIKHLRDKLGSAGACIVGVRGVGYRLET